MRLASSLEAFIADPFDAYVVHPSFVFWQRGKDLNGCRICGALTIDAVDALFECFETDVHPEAEPHVSIVDFRGMTYTDLESMAHFARTLEPKMRRFQTRVMKRILVHGPGGLGIAVGGVRVHVPDLYPVRLVTEVEPHLEWLGVAKDDPILKWLAETVDSIGTMDELRRALRAAFNQGHETLEACAKHLGQSERSLQRRLAERGSSFRDERIAHRLELVRYLLANSPDTMTLEAIAQRAGFASQQHLTRAFSAHVGTTPAAYRAEHHPRFKR